MASAKNSRGFTFVEAIVISVIVAILAAVAIPIYGSYVQRARIDSARAACQLIGSAVAHHHFRGDTVDANDWDGIGITDPSDDNWDYVFPALNPDEELDESYAIAAVTADGDSGWFKPKESKENRWTGELAYPE